jgi:hypothetical protein
LVDFLSTFLNPSDVDFVGVGADVKRAALVLCSGLVAAVSGPVCAQAPSPPVPLTVVAGRSLDIVLDARVVIKNVGQQVSGMIVEPVYAYDRIVIPAGTKVTGHVATIDGAPKIARFRAALSGDLAPARSVRLQFDTLILGEEAVSFESVVTAEIPHVRRAVAPPLAENEDASKDQGPVGRTERKIKERATMAIADARQQARDVLSELKQPGRKTRLKDAVIQRLPYHPQVIAAGTGYRVDLLAPMNFGAITPAEWAPSSGSPNPSSIINARLLATLSSATTARGSPVKASITEPLFSVDHQLIVPEGTEIDGTVTQAKPARRMHRNGQLRFLVERIHRSSGESSSLLASLSAVEVRGDASVTIDDEGGTTVKNPKTRFIAPALAVLALRANLDEHEHLDPDGDGHIIRSGSPGARTTGGFFGLGLLGIGLSQISRPVGVALSIVGASRTMYRNVLGKGQEVEFPAGTVMQLRLAPGPGSAAGSAPAP